MISKIAEGLYRGPRINWHRDIADIMRLEIKTVLNLEAAYDNEDVKECLKYGIQPLELNFSPYLPPTGDQIKVALDILTNQKFKPTLMHCRRGKDRTGFVVAAYRMEVDRWERDKALQELRTHGMSLWLCWWTLFL